MEHANLWLRIATVSATLAWLSLTCAVFLMGTYVFFVFAIVPLGFGVLSLLVALVALIVGCWEPRPPSEIPWGTWIVTLLPFAALGAWLLQEYFAPYGSQLGWVAVPVLVVLAMLMSMPLQVVYGGRGGLVALGIGGMGVLMLIVTWWLDGPI